ncbi:MAG TPA: isoaspartyl peptidase/L-asparaginase [Gammaproteobacteria bacterium]|nr:isoaspartyl peptidase/L-asparaginase [Gammaproteobacteria bacterium]
MRNLNCILLSACILISSASMHAVNAAPASPPIAIVIHGGAGTFSPKDMTPALESEYRATLRQALKTGYAVLKKDGTSLDAVQAAIEVMEDSPLFNAGKGSVFTHDGKHEMDASIMDGSNLKAGGVADVQHIKNPIALARLVMDKTPHVLLVADGAEKFAVSQGMPLMPASYFYTQQRWDELQRALKKEGNKTTALEEQYPGATVHGFDTVGAVALDRYGNIAAGTSTGGLTNKLDGRVGDSPLTGDGTYANNATCGASGTGTGEYYMRLNLTKDVSDLMKYKGWPLKKAVNYEINDKLVKFSGKNSGGLIALDRNGNIATAFNTTGMYRGWIDTRGRVVVKIFKGE